MPLSLNMHWYGRTCIMGIEPDVTAAPSNNMSVGMHGLNLGASGTKGLGRFLDVVNGIIAKCALGRAHLYFNKRA